MSEHEDARTPPQLRLRRAVRGCVFYDGECAICVGFARRFGPVLRRHGFELAPLPEASKEMRLLTAAGEMLGGADALVELARQIWWGWPLWVAAQMPGVKPLLRAAYRRLAARRHCLGGQCQIRQLAKSRSNRPWGGWLLAFGLGGFAFSVRPHLPAWVLMWAMAFGIFAVCKWVTWQSGIDRQTNAHSHASPPHGVERGSPTRGGLMDYHRAGSETGAPRKSSPQASGIPAPTLGLGRSLGYLLFWVGMDANTFLQSARVVVKPKPVEWVFALLKACFGAVLVWGVVRLVPAGAPLLRGWIGLIGCVFLLHFGLFHLLALAWQRAGAEAQPIMRAPILSKSLGEFWGQRWNLAFHQLAHELAFRPLRQRLGASLATVAVFLLSGLVHEAVISLPAGGGYGFPTLYFVLQGLGVLWERSSSARRFGLARGWRGRVFTWVWTAGPAGLLFHAPFINKVILPFFHEIGAT